ncbi:hypothetical protein O181_089863, partial [Austropuccinia psidii MF-1]|nr:hypothetical protein [Austropuccinia psidii MF-1]
MTVPTCLLHPLIVGQPQAFIRTPQKVIRRQLSHAWQTFYCQYSDRLFAWSGGQLDCKCSPTCVRKPEANQCGFDSASSALASSRPMFAWGSVTAGHLLHILTPHVQVVAPVLQPKNTL